jgi:hypothetical protein
MSYYTQVQLAFEGADSFAAISDEKIQPMLASAAAGFDLYPPQKVNPFLVRSAEDWFSEKLLPMSGFRDQAEEFLKYMSLKFPGVTFYARGLGEEFSDVWFAAFIEGEPSSE